MDPYKLGAQMAAWVKVFTFLRNFTPDNPYLATSLAKALIKVNESFHD